MTNNLIAALEAAEGPMQVEVTKADIMAAEQFWAMYCGNNCGDNPLAWSHLSVSAQNKTTEAFARHRIAERKAIVDWLNEKGFAMASAVAVAERIKRGEHMKGQAHD